MKLWGRLGRGLAALVFPPVCVHCRGPVASEGEYAHLCPDCARQLVFVTGPACQTCGHPFHGAVEGARDCPHCIGLQPAFQAGFTAVLLRGPARSLVLELKYHRGLFVLADVERIFARSPLPDRVRDAVLVPVPLHPRKRRHRGYNQSELLAQALARVAGGRTRVAGLVRRTADTRTQTAFDRQTRLRNLKNAFALAPRARVDCTLRHILVDDVFTTGATLNSCARVLRRRGCLNLKVVTFGHG